MIPPEEPTGRIPESPPKRTPALAEEIPGRGQRIAVKLVVPLALLLGGLLLVFWVWFDTAVVVGPSMLPTLTNGEYVLLSKGYKVPLRGEIVVFTEPGPDGRPMDIIKRVAGVPGDEVEVVDGKAYVNGQPETPHPGVFVGADRYGPVQVPEGTVFLLGDNRPVSLDSRDRGPIPLLLVRGRAVAIFLPLWSMRILPR